MHQMHQPQLVAVGDDVDIVLVIVVVAVVAQAVLVRFGPLGNLRHTVAVDCSGVSWRVCSYVVVVFDWLAAVVTMIDYKSSPDNFVGVSDFSE